MSGSVRTIGADKPVAEAVEAMHRNDLKRLPVVDEEGRLVGVITRLDVLRAAVSGLTEEPAAPASGYVEWEGVPRVQDCMSRETGTVGPDTSLDEALRTLDERSVQRIAVVDADGRLLGLLTDRDILAAISHRPEGLVRAIIDRLPLPGVRRAEVPEITLETTAGEIMETDLITVTEDATLEQALHLMVANSLKRLPVVDPEGRYQGMITRNAPLRLSVP